jgi:dihydroflavonol-4-reductase
VTRVAITGATGVVGRALLAHLVEQGFDVRALTRRESDARIVADLGATPVSGDLLEVESLVPLVADSEFVFNVAGVNEMCLRDPTKMEQVNIGGVRNVMAACRRGGVGRLIHTSSAVTIGEERGTVGDENSTHRGWFLSDYERTKTMGEEVLFTEADGLDVVAVNPSSVQGPGRATGTGRIILGVVRGDMRYLVDSTISLVDIDDNAKGHLLAARSGISGARYVLSGAVLNVRDAVELASSAVGRDLAPLYLPPTLVKVVASLGGPMARLLHKDFPFCAEIVRVMAFGHRYDGSRAARQLGLVYRSVEDTIDRTVGWFRSEGFLD